jgi:hypothetical protein
LRISVSPYSPPL